MVRWLRDRLEVTSSAALSAITRKITTSEHAYKKTDYRAATACLLGAARHLLSFSLIVNK